MTTPTRLRILAGHWSIVLMAALFVVGLFLAARGPLWVWALAPLGVALQMLREYLLHRFVFHLPPPRQQWAFDLLYQAHYGHHDFPTNKGLFFVPWWVALPFLAVDLIVARSIAGLIFPEAATAVTAAVIMVGGIATFLSYEWFHMTAHLSVPKLAVERHVTTLHNQHHFRDFSRWFHVSPGGEVIDRAFGTAIDREALKSQQRIEFMRTLGMRPDDPRLLSARERFAPRFGLTEAELTRAARV